MTFALKNMEVRQAVHAQFCFEIFRFLEHVKKLVNKIGELLEDDGTYFPA